MAFSISKNKVVQHTCAVQRLDLLKHAAKLERSSI